MIDFRRKNQYLPSRGFLKRKGKSIQFSLWFVPIFLVFLSSLLIASTQRQVNFANWYDHIFTGFLGLAIAFWLSLFPLERLRPYLYLIYGLTLISLISVCFLGTSALGAQRWLSFAGINLQPSELAKLTCILVLAAVLEKHKFDAPSKIFRPLAVIAFPWALIFIQPDLGTSLVFGAILLVMLYWSGMPSEWGIIVLSLILTACIAGIFPFGLILWVPIMGLIAYKSFPRRNIFLVATMASHGLVGWFTPWLWINALKDYQRDRLILFLDPSKDPLGGGYHLIQSKIGIGSGGMFGAGILQGQLTRLNFIPEQHTDFIFSALGEEGGFIGTMIVISAFFLFISRIFKLAKEARTDFESLVVIGIGTMFMFQVVVNIFMTIGLGPVTGIPLPFMSYGRTALLVNFTALGFCLSVARRSQLVGKNW